MTSFQINYQRYRWHLLLLSLLQISMSSGMIYGFASLRDMLKRHRVDGEVDLVSLGQMGFTAVALSQFVSGLLLDAVGPKICSGLCMLMLCLGTFLLSFGPQYPNVLYVACFLIGLGGPGTQVSTIHVSALFPNRRGLAVSLQIGAFQVSILLFLFVKHICHHGYSFQAVLVTLAVCQMILAVISFIIWPMRPFKSHLTTVATKSGSVAGDGHRSSYQFRIPRGTKALEIRKSLWSQMFTSSYFALMLFLPIVMLYLNSFLILTREHVIAAFRTSATVATEDVLQMYTDLSQLLLLCGVVANTMFGFVIDRFGIAKSGFLVVSLILAYSVALLSSVCHQSLLAVAFVLYPISRSCFFAWVFFVLSVDFGYKHFGMLAGVLFLVNSVIFLSHGYLFRTLFGANIVAWNISQVVITVLMFCIPLYWLQRGVSHKDCKEVSSRSPNV